eukprot:7785589-Alexandrium_andersonii.AAC.1
MGNQGKERSGVELEHSLALTALVSQFSAIAQAVVEGQGHSKAMHEEPKTQRSVQEQSNLRHEA